MTFNFLSNPKMGSIVTILAIVFVLGLASAAIYQINPEILGFDDEISQNKEDVFSQSQNFELEKDQVFTSGTFSAEATYESPGGDDIIETTMVLENGVIQDVEIISIQAGKKSAEYISDFNDGIDSVIVGKTLDEDLDPGIISGASLTRIGFLDTVNQIRATAVESQT